MDANAHIEHRSSISAARFRSNGIYWPGATIILVNCTLGAGLLALPFAFAEVGSLPVAIGIQLLVCVPVALSVVLLGYCAAFPIAVPLHDDSACVNRTRADERTPLLGATPHASAQPHRTQAARSIDANDVNEPTYERVCGRIGRPASFAASLAVALYTFASCVALLVIIGDNVDKLFLCAFGDRFCDRWYLSRQFTIPAAAFVFILPLCFARRMDFLKIPSAIGVLGLFYVVALVALKYYLPDAPTSFCRNAATPIPRNTSASGEDSESSLSSSFSALIYASAQMRPEQNSSTPHAACVCAPDAPNATRVAPGTSASPALTALHSVSVFCLAYQSHVSAVPVFACVARRPSGSGSGRGHSRVGEWARAVLANYVLCSMVYVCVGAFGYYKFGARVQSDVLNNYAPDALVLVAIALLALKLCVTYPTSSLVGCQTLLGYADHLVGCFAGRRRLRSSTPTPTPQAASTRTPTPHDSSMSDADHSINASGGGSLGRPYSNEITFGQRSSVSFPIADPPEPDPPASRPGARDGSPSETGNASLVESALARVVCALLWFALALLPAVLVRSLGQVIGVLGSIAALLMFFFPGLALLGVARDLKRLRSASAHLRQPQPVPHEQQHAEAPPAGFSSAAGAHQPHPETLDERTPPSPSYTQSTLVAHGGGDAFFRDTARESAARRGLRGRHYTPPPLDASSPALLNASRSEFISAAAVNDSDERFVLESVRLVRSRAFLVAGALVYMALGVLLFIYMLTQSVIDLVAKPSAVC